MLGLFCWAFGHRPPPPPADLLALTVGTGHAPCARCGARVELARRRDGKIVASRRAA